MTTIAAARSGDSQRRQKNIGQLPWSLAQLYEKARTRKISLDEMQGAVQHLESGRHRRHTRHTISTRGNCDIGIRVNAEPVLNDGAFVPR